MGAPRLVSATHSDPWTTVSRSADQTMTIGRVLASRVGRGDVIALFGPLGAGKTQFVRGLAAGLGIDSHQVASPTFVFVREYPNPGGGPVLVHIDAYRVNGPTDCESIGWEVGGGELAREAVVVIEWADRMGDALGDDHLQIRFAHEDEHTRRLSFVCRGAWMGRSRAIRDALATVNDHGSVEPGCAHGADARCPICGAGTTPEDPSFPFCSPRCRTIDLGRWLDGKYLISRPLAGRQKRDGRRE